jgi:hypothetical protein
MSAEHFDAIDGGITTCDGVNGRALKWQRDVSRAGLGSFQTKDSRWTIRNANLGEIPVKAIRDWRAFSTTILKTTTSTTSGQKWRHANIHSVVRYSRDLLDSLGKSFVRALARVAIRPPCRDRGCSCRGGRYAVCGSLQYLYGPFRFTKKTKVG